MRKYIICIVSFIGAALLQTGCYDDKGDYDYHDVNTMDIVIPETKVRMPKEEAVEVSNYTRRFLRLWSKMRKTLYFNGRKQSKERKRGRTDLVIIKIIP